MIIVRFVGGLGNQMFQYAFAKKLARDRGSALYADLTLLKTAKFVDGITPSSFSLDIFDVTIPIIDPDYYLSIQRDKVYFTERMFSFDNKYIQLLNFLLPDTIIILTGYWQSSKYFIEHWSLIKKDFEFIKPVTGKWELLKKLIEGSFSVMVNIRRGDYTNTDKEQYHGLVNVEYLKKSMQLIKERLSDCSFFVFSDDISWCKKNLPKHENIFFVGKAYYDEKFQFYMQLMCSCKHFIISNSTFSWWAAFIGQKDDSITIAPQNWFKTDLDSKDLFPPDWILL